MDLLSQILNHENEFNNNQRDADLGRAYLRITEEMGPSAQLMAFVNQDNGFGQAMGLESFGSYSLTTQHEIMAKEINPEVLDTIALENLAEQIDKTATWFKAVAFGGLIGSLISGNFILGSVSYLSVIAGEIVIKTNYKINGKYPYEKFQRLTKAFEAAYAYDKEFASKIPNSFDLKDWLAFDKNEVNSFDSKLETLFSHYDDADFNAFDTEKTLADETGWDEAKFTAAAKWLHDSVKRIETLELAHVKKLEHIRSWVKLNERNNDNEVRQVYKHISRTVGKTVKLSRLTSSVIKDANHVLSKIGHMFEEKK